MLYYKYKEFLNKSQGVFYFKNFLTLVSKFRIFVYQISKGMLIFFYFFLKNFEKKKQGGFPPRLKKCSRNTLNDVRHSEPFPVSSEHPLQHIYHSYGE